MPLNRLDALKVLLIRKSWRLQKASNVTVHDRREDTTISIPILGGLGRNLVGPSDVDLQQTIKKVLSFRRGPVVDVGANVGMFLKCLVELDRDVPYVAFEPDLSCCNYLEQFVRRNGLARHSVFPVGLGAGMEVLDLQFSTEGDVSATVMSGFRPSKMYSDTKKILVEAGDSILSRLFQADRICLIKVDAEGAELLVLRGLSKTIAVHRPFLILEVSPYQHFLNGQIDEGYFGHASPEEMASIARWRQDFIADLDAFLASNRYGAMKIRANGDLEPVASVDPGTQTSFAELNYLAVPQEDEAAFQAGLRQS